MEIAFAFKGLFLTAPTIINGTNCSARLFTKFFFEEYFLFRIFRSILYENKSRMFFLFNSFWHWKLFLCLTPSLLLLPWPSTCNFQSRFCFKVQLVPDDILFRLTKIRQRSMQIQDSNSDFGELLTQLAHFENYNQRCIKSVLNYIPNLRRLPWLTTNRERCGYRLVSDSRDIFQSWSTKWVSN